MTKPRYLLEQLAMLKAAIDRQEAVNEENIASSLNTLEAVIRRIGLDEPLWVEMDMPNLPSQVFGWSGSGGEWYLAFGDLESCPDPDSGKKIVYASSEKRVVDCTPFEQARAFESSESLIEAIHDHLKSRYEDSKCRGEEILARIRKLDELLKKWRS